MEGPQGVEEGVPAVIPSSGGLKAGWSSQPWGGPGVAGPLGVSGASHGALMAAGRSWC